MGTEDDSACLLIDFSSVHATVLEDWFIDEDKTGRRCPSPNTIHDFAKAVTHQINYFGIIYGSRHREGRIKALRILLEISEGDPDLSTVEFIGSV